MVKSPAALLPPLSLTTCLITIRCAACRVFVKVQLTFSPSLRLTLSVVPEADCVPPFGVVTVQGGFPKLRVHPAGAAALNVYVAKLVMPGYVRVFDSVGSESSSSEKLDGERPPVAEKPKSCGSFGTASFVILIEAGKITA